MLHTDAVIVGGGLAGLWAALHLPADWEVVVVDKGRGPTTGSSPWAQGGMAVAVGPDDSPHLHAADTIRAGAGACDEAAVGILVDEAPGALRELRRLGCAFDAGPSGDLDLNREGGQTVARSVHAADATGREIMRVVVSHARQRAQRVEGAAAGLLIDDGRCVGVSVQTPHGRRPVLARATLMATGGCGALWPATTNPATSTGDAVALAYRAGAAVGDLEFMQFHPTALDAEAGQRVLLTEALRGEGATIVDADGRRFLADVHPDAELAPRDIVARAIAERGGAFLDARGVPGLLERFPNVTDAARRAGFDMSEGPVPIAPAAHYFLGGICTDTDGRTDVAGLFAAGECATTGLHGANRMAGNSLTEAVVFGRRTAVAMAASDAPPAAAPEGVAGQAGDVHPDIGEVMATAVGLTRDAAGLRGAVERLDDLPGPSAVTASLICRAALERTESRGVHFRVDHPEPSDAWAGRRLRYASG